MARPRFSEFLSNRRRQLGLSVAQAARVLRLKDQVLIAFEEGDWDRIPRSGYAQGMLSSYARYLGLNPREVIDLFQEDLNAYASGHGNRGYRDDHSSAYGNDPVYELPNTTTSSPRLHPKTNDKDLYGSAGPAGSILTGTSVAGTYLTPASSPLVNGRSAGYSDRYLSQRGASSRDAGQNRPYTARTPRTGSANGRRAQGRNQQPRTARAADDARRLSSNTAPMRRTRSSSYDDDLRYEQASPYESASTAQGRSASHNIVQPQRPNVRRRTSTEQQRSTRGRRPQPQRSGVMGVLDAWFSDRTRTIATIFGALAIALLLIIVFSVKSCASSPKPDNKDQIAVSQTDTSKDDSAANTSSADKDANAATVTTKPAEEPKPTKVEVTVTLQDGAVTWIEIQNGGKSLVADTLNGPWEQTYTVNGTLSVRTSDPSVVEVTANGKPVTFDTMVSGIGTATVEGPEPEENTDTAAQGEDGTSDGTATASVDGTGTGTTDGQSADGTATGYAADGTGTANGYAATDGYSADTAQGTGSGSQY